MSDFETHLNPEQQDQTTANLQLLGQFIHEMVENPEQFDELPDDATVVLLPSEESDDLQLTRANLELVKQAVQSGHHVNVLAVSMPAKQRTRLLSR
jgi:hypothetical protein